MPFPITSLPLQNRKLSRLQNYFNSFQPISTFTKILCKIFYFFTIKFLHASKMAALTKFVPENFETGSHYFFSERLSQWFYGISRKKAHPTIPYLYQTTFYSSVKESRKPLTEVREGLLLFLQRCSLLRQVTTNRLECKVRFLLFKNWTMMKIL